MDLRRLYIVANAAKEGSLRALAVLKAWCQLKEVEPILVEQGPPPEFVGEGALVVALGGDGTVLRAAAIFAELGPPILWVNLGSLGFLTQVGAPSLTSTLEGVLQDQFSIEERMRLSFAAGGEKGTVLNDVVISGVSPMRFCELDLDWSEGRVATYPGDGLIVATATGSTAYNLSAGGPVVVPPAEAIVVTPLDVHKLGLRSVVFPASEVLRVRVRTPAKLFGDGDLVSELPPETEVTIERSPTPTRLIRMVNAPSFFDLLEGSLNWGDDRRRSGR